jgi:hypothetical protein
MSASLALTEYAASLADEVGAGWNRFWFTPSDPLPASVLRIPVGLLALAWVGSFTPELVEWLGPQGWLPPASVAQLTGAVPLPGMTGEMVFRPSPFNYLAEAWQVWVVHSLCLAAVFAFTAGLWARITGPLAALAVLSYIHRDPFITDQFEALLVPALIYLAIAPSGAYLSLDRCLLGRDCSSAAPADWTATLALRLLQIHLTAFFLLSALAKLSAGTEGLHAWWLGEAAWSLIAKTDSRVVDLSGLRDSLFLVNFWTHAIVAYELAFVPLAWSPLLRPLVLAAGVIVWTSIALVTGLFLYCVLMIVLTFAFVPAEGWRMLLGMNAPAPPLAEKAA